ncbi:hypothetical protein CDL12_04355 [Handroanthus impetiginosus]|uniref:Transcription factor IIIC 90kDa subunit N-terminal domain-containing protein n=1 Tax=Handroanthus impetiginosus TaxID=429701 RepID=A0A2G9HZH5_9LAMI|nr:hypothetical protein CDL12_04355 [Handroanthus impetiginosus]
MSSRFESTVLGSPLVYPNAVVWSEENLVAVACGSTVIILNPANPGIRGVITIPSGKPFPVGMIDGGDADLQSGCMLPFHLSRDTRPCVRSISWSPMGLANNAGCLLAVCTTAGRVKLYRFPFCEFSVEWVEVLDISEMLYNYFESTSFGEHQIVSSETLDVIPRKDNADHECASDLPVYGLRNKRRRQNAVTLAASDPDNMKENDTWQIVPHSSHKGKTQEKASEDCNLPLITVQQYASRNEMLMSLTMAWSPVLGTSENGIAVCHNSSSSCSILAVGGKCGRISFWRIQAPECYSINNTRYPIKVLLVGLLKAHDTWITAINWAPYGSNVSKPRLLLASGSSDGRVKIWKVNGDELLKSSEVNDDSFALWNEVMTVDPAIISVLSLTVPSQSPSRLLLAIGKASGSFEVWDLDCSTNRFEKVGCYNAHDRIVTGLAWALEGRCLYSCSQDNSMKSWILVGNSLQEVSIPSNNPGLKSSSDVPCVFESCFGLAVSPGNLAIAVARKFDVDLLHPMYEGRTHRAALEFLWIGGQQLDLSSTCPDIDNKYFPGFPQKELIWWESNIIQTLKQYENPSRPLNIWDIVAALLAFKQSAPEYVEHVLLKWLTSYFGSQFGISMTLLSEASKFLPKLSSRQLHLINIISRRVVLKEGKADNISSKQQELERIRCTKEEQVNLWMELLRRSENELLERLVCISFSAILSCLSDSSMGSFKAGGWSPDGLPQMEQWVSQNEENIKDHSRSLAAEVRKVEKRRLQDLFQYEVDEQCNFCSAVVPFESTDYAICSGLNRDNGVDQRHKLDRCAVTLQILPVKPSWYCMCCQRWATKLPPSILFRMSEYPSDFISMMESCAYKDSSMPYCPFCGILLQRSQPEHSLSPSPV